MVLLIRSDKVQFEKLTSGFEDLEASRDEDASSRI